VSAQPRSQLDRLLRTRGRGQVEVVVTAVQQGVTHPPADQGDLETRALEELAELGGDGPTATRRRAARA
jgi:hypothetical protein